jgi:serine/threonine-protein kinase
MPLGSGGMGEVLEAVHVELDRRVVVKLLHQVLVSEAKLVDRLRVEARTLATLAHPHIVTVSDFGRTPAGRPYFVMERLYGRTLREELSSRGFLPLVEAIMYVCQVLSGLAAAHQLGIIHRDVKTDNVFLCCPEGAPPFVKLLDFGIAKILGVAGRRRGPTPQYPTQEGILLGTPRTLAPEQARGQAVDARTDIYAVGILLYTLIVGEGPFSHARDQPELLQAHISELPKPPSLLARQPIPVELDRAVLTALAKLPEERFQTAEQFGDELKRIAGIIAITPSAARLAGAPSTQPPAPPPAPSSPAAAPGDDDAPTVLNSNSVYRPGSTRGSQVWLFVAVTIASLGLFSALFAVALHFLGEP